MLKLTGNVGVLDCQYGAPQNRENVLKLIAVIDVLWMLGVFGLVSWLCA